MATLFETFPMLSTIIPVIQTKQIKKSACMSMNKCPKNPLLSQTNRFAKTRSKGRFFLTYSVFGRPALNVAESGQPSFSKLVTAPRQNQNPTGYPGKQFCQQNCRRVVLPSGEGKLKVYFCRQVRKKIDGSVFLLCNHS